VTWLSTRAIVKILTRSGSMMVSRSYQTVVLDTVAIRTECRMPVVSG